MAEHSAIRGLDDQGGDLKVQHTQMSNAKPQGGDPYAHPTPSRPVVMGVSGMVASANPLSTLAGVAVLREGGNAFDAAVAVASTLGVVEPYMSGVGGIGVALAYVAAEDRVRALDFSGRAPLAALPEEFTQETKGIGPRSCLVPGNVAGWLTMQESYGTMAARPLFDTAIRYAEHGSPVTFNNHRMIVGNASRLLLHPQTSGLVLGADGTPPGPGARLRFPQLAASLRSIAEGGIAEFYRGDLARRFVRGNQEIGGLMTGDDLASYEAEWLEPVKISYRGLEVLTTPPSSSGFQILQTLKLLEHSDIDARGPHHPDTVHRFIEAVKLAVSDRIPYAGDPATVSAPLDRLLSDEYAAERCMSIDMSAAGAVSGEHYSDQVPAGAIPAGLSREIEGGMTTHFAIADSAGNVVSVTQTLGGAFGSAVAMGDTGIFPNNMGYWFDLDEGSPNRIGPGKKVDFVVAPTQTFEDGRFMLSMGTPGSWGILQTTPQMLVNVLDHGMTVQQAIDSPRFRVYEGTRVEMEDRFPTSLRIELELRGHQVDVIESWSMNVGGAQAIAHDSRAGIFHGGADPRRDGVAIGL